MSNTNTEDFKVDTTTEDFQAITNDRNAAIADVKKMYGDQMTEIDNLTQDQINAAKSYAAQQSKNTQDRTDFTIEQINQQKDQAKKDYTKEQSASYVDWQKQSNEYGANAEAQAAQGMAGTGYSESSQVAMYNQYQNRIMAARESYQRAVLNYDNAIKDAQLQNNSLLAEIAYQALQASLEATIAAAQQKNSLLQAMVDDKIATNSLYDSRWDALLDQKNTELARAEAARQFNANYQLELDKFNYQKAQDAKAAVVNKTKTQKVAAKRKTGTLKTNKERIAADIETTKKDHEDQNTPVDMKSLTKIGLAGRSAAYVNKLVEQGQLTERYNPSTGKLEFKWAAPKGLGSMNLVENNRVFQKR